MANRERKPGELIRTFGDFWLGMAGAAAKGVSAFSKARRDEKTHKEHGQDFFTNAAAAVEAIFEEAKEVASQTKGEIGDGKTEAHKTAKAAASQTEEEIPGSKKEPRSAREVGIPVMTGEEASRETVAST